MPDIDKDLQKEAVKEALKEWMDEQWNRQLANFGRWVLISLLVAAFGGLVYLALVGQGWKK